MAKIHHSSIVLFSPPSKTKCSCSMARWARSSTSAGVLFSSCYEELNVSRPELVTKVHEDYVQCGRPRSRN